MALLLVASRSGRNIFYYRWGVKLYAKARVCRGRRCAFNRDLGASMLHKIQGRVPGREFRCLCIRNRFSGW